MPTDEYGALADTALARLTAIDDGAQLAFVYAYAASAAGARHGWDNAVTVAYLDKVRSLRVAGGWPANTTSNFYTITLADHVGPVLLEAYQHAAASSAEVMQVANLLIATPCTTTAAGQCVSYLTYSTSADCVHNQNAAVGLFLDHVRAAGLSVAGADALVAQITRREAAAYNPTARAWPYSDTQQPISDADHTSLSAEAALTLSPAIGRQAVDKLMTTAYAGSTEVNSPLAHLRAGAFDPARTGDWLAEAQTYQAGATQASSPTRQAQIARWAARIAVGGA